MALQEQELDKPYVIPVALFQLICIFTCLMSLLCTALSAERSGRKKREKHNQEAEVDSSRPKHRHHHHRHNDDSSVHRKPKDKQPSIIRRPKEDQSDDDDDKVDDSQRPPRPGVVTVVKKRKKNERARKREQHEKKMAEKMKKAPPNLSLLEFIKYEVLHMKPPKMMKKTRAKKHVERGPVFKPTRHRTPDSKNKDRLGTFCMPPKRKKMVVFDTKREFIEKDRKHGADEPSRSKDRVKDEPKPLPEKVSDSSKSPTSSDSSAPKLALNLSSKPQESDPLQDVIKKVSEDEDFSKEYGDLFADEPVQLANGPDLRKKSSFKDKILKRVNELRPKPKLKKILEKERSGDSSDKIVKQPDEGKVKAQNEVENDSSTSEKVNKDSVP